MAIMGFGGGAFIASPLSVWLMSKFSTSSHIGVAETFIVMGAIYFIFMVVGSIIVRVPAPDWKPEGYTPPAEASKLITKNDVFVYTALKTPQFWLIWWVLCLNVTAGIGVLGQASAMSQEMFPGKVGRGRGRGLRRTDEHLQHGRLGALWVGLRLDGTQEHLLRLSHAGSRIVFRHRAQRQITPSWFFSWC